MYSRSLDTIFLLVLDNLPQNSTYRTKSQSHIKVMPTLETIHTHQNVICLLAKSNLIIVFKNKNSEKVQKLLTVCTFHL